ncbi:hypothetical protein BaRGS_00035671 [Batillaria attramentaria]|uniref:Ig-like domain-containing protein n=1 Tax=Batillaria attramentaria TaxID=370345 RepID=A0ABD0JE26_9CAEN
MEETICLLVFLCFSPISAGDGIAHNCSEYVNEGLGVDCQCIDRAPVGDTRAYQVTWPGHSNTSRLKLSAVSRNDNGSTFVCLAERPGSIENTTFTLQVACELCTRV